jgi:hypothetical protein
MYSDDESHRKTTKFGMKASFSKNDEENNGAVNEKILYKDDIQRFIEAYRPENTKKNPITT